MAEFEALDLSEMQSEFERVSAEPGSAAQTNDLQQMYVRLPERDGYVQLRLLPRKKGSKFYCATRVHTLINPTTKQRKSYHCPRNLVQTERGSKWQGDCIVCKYYSDLWQQSMALEGKAQQDLQNAARAIKPVERYFYNVIVRSEKDSNGDVRKNVGPKIYSCGKTVHAKIMRAIVGDESAGEPALGDVSHPVHGRDFRVVKKVVKSGSQEYPNYDNSKFEDVSPAGNPEELDNWIEHLHDLQALRVIKSDDELRHALKVHLGMIKEGEAAADDLSEFRGSNTVPASSVVKEEISVKPAVAETTPSYEEPLADEDFMKELASM